MNRFLIIGIALLLYTFPVNAANNSLLAQHLRYQKYTASAKTLFNQGKAYFKIKNFSQAISVWKQAVETGGLSQSAYHSITTSLLQVKEYSAALDFSKNYVSAYPKKEEGYATALQAAKLLDADTSKGLALEQINAYNNFLQSDKKLSSSKKQTLFNNYSYLFSYYAQHEKNYTKAAEVANRLVALYPNATDKTNQYTNSVYTSNFTSNYTFSKVKLNMPDTAALRDTFYKPFTYANYTSISADNLMRRGEVFYCGKNYDQAYLNWLASDSLGNKYASRSLGRLYEKGLGVPQDYGKAMSLYKKAAIGGVPDAHGLVGNLYENGLGVPQDYTKALEWYNIGKLAGDTLTDKYITTLQAKINPPSKAISRPNVDPKTVVYTNTVLTAAPSIAKLSANDLYNKGFDSYKLKDFAGAKAYWEKAGEMRTPAKAKYQSMNMVGELYRNGEGVPQDYEQAMQWYVKASANGLPIGSEDAAKSAGSLYENGYGVGVDFAKALLWYKKAQRMGNKYVADDVKRMQTKIRSGE